METLCQDYVEDPAICDDLGEPKGQCVNCGYKEHEHLILAVNRVYRAKKPAQAGYGFVNDRQVLHVGPTSVQYDGPAVRNGGHYPKVSHEKFLTWAAADVTDQMPTNGDWVNWFDYKDSKPT